MPEKFDACRKAGADAVVDPRGLVAERLLESDARRGGRRGGRLRLDHRDAGSRRQGARPSRPPGHARRGAPASRSACRRRTCSTRSRISSAAATSPVPRSWRSLDLVARGEVFPLVTVVRPLEEAEAVHDLVERGEVTGRAALRVA